MKRIYYIFACLFILLNVQSIKPAMAQEPLIGEIKLVGFTYCPRGWTDADGQLLSITDNAALFSLYGTTYGGDGRTTFALPDLRGRVPLHQGTGAGLSTYTMGQLGGAETVTLTTSQMPVHNHTFTELERQNGTAQGIVVRSGSSSQATPTSDTGGGEAHENRPPLSNHAILRSAYRDISFEELSTL